MADEQNDVLVLTAEITASYLGNAAHVKAEDIPSIIRSIRSALTESSEPQAAEPESKGPAPKLHSATVKKSITPDALISFIDNKPYKTLKRHLTRHGHDMKSYREAYGLPADYPSVAPAYSAARSEMARSLGLGNKGRGAKTDVGATAPAPETAAAPAKRGRKATATATS